MPNKFSAPGRTELAGNHTDHNRGKVLAAAVNLEITADVEKTDDNTVTFRSAGFRETKVELSDLSPESQEKETTASLICGIAAEFKKRGYRTGGFCANAVSAVPPGSGLSSSAAVEVLIARIFDSLYNEGSIDPLEAAQIGQIAENSYFGKPCGLMDQIACSFGGAVAVDFADEARPVVKKIGFDPAAYGYTLCIVNTGGSHADLTADYAAIPAEMKAVAAFFGKQVLRELDKETVLSRAAEVRAKAGDRALLRALHFFDENARVDEMAAALERNDIERYLTLVNKSGCSSSQLLQNIYSPACPGTQGISAALALTEDFFSRQKTQGADRMPGACRVHGGGFAGTIQAYIPTDAMDAYRAHMEAVFGAGTVTELRLNTNIQN
jgi:galactokinase